jgi:hypothetical protein
MRLLAILLLCTSTTFAADCLTPCDFIRGDANGDGSVNHSDLVVIGMYLFGSGGPPANFDAADVNDDGVVDNSDQVYIAAFLYYGGNSPPAPFPSSGFDCTRDGLETSCDVVPTTDMLSYLLTAQESNVWGTWGLGIYTDIDLAWDSTDLDISGDFKSVSLTVENVVAPCDHPETSWDLRPVWGFNGLDLDPITSQALNQGVMDISWQIDVGAKFNFVGTCYSPCDPTLYNELAVDLTYADIVFTFSDEFGEDVVTASVPLDGSLRYTYGLVKHTATQTCTLEVLSGPSEQSMSRSDDDYPGALADSLCESEIDGDTPLYLDKVSVEGAAFVFLRHGGPDLAHEESIEPFWEGYSIRLSELAIVGDCN